MPSTEILEGALDVTRSITHRYQNVSFLFPLVRWWSGGPVLEKRCNFRFEKYIIVQNDGRPMLKMKIVLFPFKYGQLGGGVLVLETINNSPVRVAMSAVMQKPDGTSSQRAATVQLEDFPMGPISTPKGFKLPFNARNEWEELARKGKCEPDLVGKVVVNFDVYITYFAPYIHKSLTLEATKESSRKGKILSPAFPHVRIICCDDQEYRVHMCRLESWFDNWSALFDRSTKEEAQNWIAFADESGKVIGNILEYYETGKAVVCKYSLHLIGVVAVAAYKYGCKDLKIHLDKILGNERFARSTLELLDVAVLCGYKTAEKQIVKNIGKRLARAKIWEEFAERCRRNRKPNVCKFPQAKKKLEDWVDGEIGGNNTVEVSLELLEAAAAVGWKETEKEIARQLGKKASKAKTSSEMFEILQYSRNYREREPATSGNSTMLKVFRGFRRFVCA